MNRTTTPRDIFRSLCLSAVTGILACPSRDTAIPRSATTDSIQGAVADTSTLPRESVTVAGRARWRARLRWPADCEQAFAQTNASDDGGLEFHQLETGVSIVLVRCASGAYQPSHLVLWLKEPPASAILSASVLHFPTWQSSDGKNLTPAQVYEVFGELAVLEGGRVLTVLSLARQIGDCGTWARYRLLDGRPQLELFAERVACPPAPGQRAEPGSGRPPSGWRRITP